MTASIERRYRRLVVAGLCALAAPPTLRAQNDSVAAARPTGAYTEAQAGRGQAVFRAVCAQCHVASLFAGASFRRSWTGRPAFDLFELIRTRMPDDNPGRLRRQEYADVLAYLFKLNGVPAGAVELPADPDSLRRIVFQPAPAPAPDPRH